MIRLTGFVVRIWTICIVIISIAHRISTNPVCTSFECSRLGAAYLNNMDQNVSACTDFYEYACRKWGIQNPAPRWEAVWSVQQSMLMKAGLDMKFLLENFPAHNIKGFEDAKAVYRACMNIPSLPRVDSNKIKDIMSKIGNWPMLHPKKKDLPSDITWSLIDNRYLQITGESAFFGITVGADLTKNDQIILHFSRPASPYGTLIRTTQWDKNSRQKEHYKNFLYKVIETVSPLTPLLAKKALEKDLDDVINFRESLREICDPSKSDDYYLEPIEQFQAWYNQQTHGSKDTAKIDWLQKARSVYTSGMDPQNRMITHNTRLAIQAIYTADLVKLLGKTPKRVIVNHIHLYFAERHVEIDSDMEKILTQSISMANRKNTLRDLTPRWKWCVSTHNLKTILTQLYVGINFPPQYKAEVESLFNGAKGVLQRQVSYSTWLSNDMKNKSMQMVGNIKGAIGYPESYEKCSNSSQPRTLELDPISMAMCHIPGPSEIYASAANLQTPIYTHNVPYVINYGATVSMLGHELYHAFGEIGLQNAYGTNKPLWPPDTYQEYMKRKKCFENQYDKYRDDELKHYNLRSKTKLKPTFNEDLSDVMGLKLAYEGFKEEMARRNRVCHVLPGFEKIGCEKLFFIAFANTMCARAKPGVIEELSMAGVHNTPRIRVNGAVANMKEFSDAFGCKSNDPLNVKKRCDLWH